MRVLLVTSWFPNADNPLSGIFVKDQAEALRANGDDVLVLHVPDPVRRRRIPWAVVRLDTNTFQLQVRQIPSALQTPFTAIATVASLRGLYAQTPRPDVVHAHTDRAAVLGAVIAKWLRRPLFVTEHSSVFLDSDPSPLRARRAKAAAWAMRQAELVFAVGPALASALQQLAPSAAVEVLPDMVDTDFFEVRRRPGQPFHFVTVALLNEHKCIDDLLRAFALVCQEHMNARLTIVGDGDDRARLQGLANDLGLHERVDFTGQCTRSQVLRHLLHASVFVSSSRFETFGLAAAEALSTGMPVVATRSGGPESFIDRESGVLVDVGDVAGLARAMLHAADIVRTRDPAAFAQHARSRFSRPAIVAALQRSYRVSSGDHTQ